MLTRYQIAAHLHELGFAGDPPTSPLAYAGIEVVVLDAPRITARTAADLVYIAVLSLTQLEEQLTGLLGYQRPPALG